MIRKVLLSICALLTVVLVGLIGWGLGHGPNVDHGKPGFQCLVRYSGASNWPYFWVIHLQTLPTPATMPDLSGGKATAHFRHVGYSKHGWFVFRRMDAHFYARDPIYAEPVYAGHPNGPSRQAVRILEMPLAVPTAIVIVLSGYLALVLLSGPIRTWRRHRKGLCLKCGYDLTGNVSGVCPECGERLNLPG